MVDFFFVHLQQVLNLEQAMMAQEISIPVFFSKYNSELENIIEDISKLKSNEQADAAEVKNAGKRESALGEIINSISANGYQVCKENMLNWISRFIYL